MKQIEPEMTISKSQPQYEVAEVWREYEVEYRAKYPLTPQQAKVMGAIAACRTAELGGHVEECRACGAWQIAYNSCRDRHCPKCEKFKREQWLTRQQPLLLPIPYFHVIFTTDHAINGLVADNRREMYELLFWAAKETLQEYGRKELGGELGVTAVLHTWGQRLEGHVHLHCIVTGGALSREGQQWRASRPDFLFPAEAFSAAYRDRFCEGLRQRYRAGQVQAEGLEVEALIEQMKAKAWEVFLKAFDQPQIVYEYLSRYVHQVAISNGRITDISQGQVRFSYYDNQAGGERKEQTLAAVEFLRRFVWHILPPGFHRIRHFGLHHPQARAKLRQVRHLLGLPTELPAVRPLTLAQWLTEVLGAETINRCPACGQPGTLTKRLAFHKISWTSLLLVSLWQTRAQHRMPLKSP